MSQRGKRGNHLHHPRLDVEPQPPPTKRRKGRPPNGGGGGGVSGGLGGGGGSGGGGGGGVGSGGSGSGVNLGNNAINCGNSGGSGTSINLSNNNNNLDGGCHTPRTGSCGGGGNGVVEDAIGSSTAKIMGSTSSAIAWQARSVADIKMSSIYNRSSTEAPAELYRKDLISAMKLPDSEQLANYEYLVVTDQWKQEWERGVQVPVNPDSLPEPYVEVLSEPIVPPARDFKLPKNRFLRISKDGTYSPELHCLTNVVALAENICAYDIDQVDEAWLKLYNADRFQYGAFPISETQFERVIEELEIRCWEQIQMILKNEEGLGIEYDENVICDVCRSPDSEEANEMVFCDNCNICVHQACYGITAIPSGQWLCRTCSIGIKPECVLCPNKGGAMKSTKSGKHWAHVSCALWIPEVSIGCVDRMEPITKISSIPQSRWALICVLCRERVGACIQCSVKTCKTAYHVTCAFQHGLEMRAIIEEGNAEDGVKLRSYCHKHSVSKGKKDANQHSSSSATSCKNKNAKNNGSGGEDDDFRKRKNRKSDLSSEERNQVRAQRLKEVEAEFDKHVNIKDISCHLFDVDEEAIEAIHNYWKLKRKSQHNRALIPPKSDDVEMIARKQEQQDIENHKLVVHLRQDLERVRNLCYMVSRREKLSRSLFRLREQVFYKQISVLSDETVRTAGAGDNEEQFKNAVIYANDGPTLYDKFYSSVDKGTPTQYKCLEYIIEKIVGNRKNATSTTATTTTTTTNAKNATKKATRRPSSSPTKRNKSANTASTSGISQQPQQSRNSTGAGKKIPTKKVNNGALSTLINVPTTAKATVTASATTTAANNGGIVTKSKAFSEYQTQAKPNQCSSHQVGRRNSYTIHHNNTEDIPTVAATTTLSRQQLLKPAELLRANALVENARIDNASMLSKNHLNVHRKSTDDSSSGTGSSSDEDDSSTENGSSSDTGSSTVGSGSRTSSTASDSSSSECETQSRVPRKSSRSKAAQQKKQSYSRSIDMRAKRKRKNESVVTADVQRDVIGQVSSATAPVKRETKTTTAAAVIAALSSASETDADGNTKKIPARVPAKPKSKSHINVHQKSNADNVKKTTTTIPNMVSGRRIENCVVSQENIDDNGLSSKKQLQKEASNGDDLQLKSSKVSSKFITSLTCKERSRGSKAKKSIGDNIYTDSSTESIDTEDKDDRTAESNVSDSQNQQTIRTKAAMKEFTLQQQVCSRSATREQQQQQNKKPLKSNTQTKAMIDMLEPLRKYVDTIGRMQNATKSDETTRSHKFITDLLVVPQRQAAKKAFENMRSTNINASSVLATTATTTTAIVSATCVSSNNSNTTRLDNDFKIRELSLSATTTTTTVAGATTTTAITTIMATTATTTITTTAATSITARHKEEKLEKLRSSRDKSSVLSSITSRSNEQSEKPNANKRGRPPKNFTKDSVESGQTDHTGYQQQQQATSTVLVSNAQQRNNKETITPNEKRRTLPTTTTAAALEPRAKSVQNDHSQISNNTTTTTTSQKNLLVAYVPQRQAAKKAAEQLKNSNKSLTLATDAALMSEEKDRCGNSEKDGKVKAPPENRTKMTTRRMSVLSNNKEAVCSQGGVVPAEKVYTTTNRRRSKDERAPNSIPIKRTLFDKKTPKLSITSSSESDSSSSSSTSDGSGSSSNSSSSCSTSEAEDEEVSATEQNSGRVRGGPSLKSSQIKGDDVSSAPIQVATPTAAVSVALSGASHKSKSPQHSLSSSYMGLDKNVEDNVERKKMVEENAVFLDDRRSPKITHPEPSLPLTLPFNSEQQEHKYEQQQQRSSKNTSLQNTMELKKLNEFPRTKFIEIVDDETEAFSKLSKKSSPEQVVKCMDEHAQSPQILPQHMEEKLYDSTTQQNMNFAGSKIVMNENKSEHFNDSLEGANKFPSVDNTTSSGDCFNTKRNEECSEVPMEIDEELTTTKTITITEGRTSSKLDELLVDLDDRPPAAPIPASPIPSSLCSNDDGSDEHSNNSGTNYQNRDCEMRLRKRRRRRRRTRTSTGSIPLSAEEEEEHTPHTQHILNEMELVRALEEERKIELAALSAEASKYSASSSSPAVAVIAPEPPEIIELDSNSNSSHKTSPASIPVGGHTPAAASTSAILAPVNVEESVAIKADKEPSPNTTTTESQQQVTSLEGAVQCIESQQQQQLQTNLNQSELPPVSMNKDFISVTQNSSCIILEATHHPIVDTILDLEDNAQLQQKQKESEQHATRNLRNSLLNVASYHSSSSSSDKSLLESGLNTASDHMNLLGNLNNAGGQNISKVGQAVSQEDSCQATRNLLEKLRKTKRSRSDCDIKETDLMLPPPTPAIPSVYPFHNAADPEDIIHAQKEHSAENTNSKANKNNSIEQQQQQCFQQQEKHQLSNANDYSAAISASQHKSMDKENQINMYHTPLPAAPTSIGSTSVSNLCSRDNNMSLLHTTLNYPVESESLVNAAQQHSIDVQHSHPKLTPLSASQNVTPQLSVSSHRPGQPTNLSSPNYNNHVRMSHPNISQTPNVIHHLPTVLQNQSNQIVKDAVPLVNSSGSHAKEVTPDFVDLHAAAAASKKSVDFTAAANVENSDSVGNKLVVDCDYDDNTRMQSPYQSMRASRIWNENDLIAERRSTSPSSVSESNDQTTPLELQLPAAAQQQHPHQHATVPVSNQMPSRDTHMHLQQSQQQALAQNLLNNNNNINSLSSQNCKNTFFNSMNNFDINPPTPFHQQQHSLHPQEKNEQQQATAASYQTSAMVNGIDAMLTFDPRYNPSQTTPTHQTLGGTPTNQQQQYNSNSTPKNQQQYSVNTTPTNQQQQQSYNGVAAVNLFHNTTSPMSNQQISYIPNNTGPATNGSIMYAGPVSGVTGNVNNTTTPTSVAAVIAQHHQQQQHTPQSAQDMYGSSISVAAVDNMSNSTNHYAAAAFTSSNHNMAITAAIVSSASQTPTNLLPDHNSPHQQHHQIQTPANQFNVPASAANAVATVPYNSVHVSPCGDNVIKSQQQQQQQQSHAIVAAKETSLKIRSNTRYSNQQVQQPQQQQQPPPHQGVRLSHKSPQTAPHHKSPGKSPRQMDIISKQLQQHAVLPEYTNCSAATKAPKFDPLTHTLAGKPRQRAPRVAGANSRGRGRGRGRGRSSNVNNSIIPLPLPMAEYVNVNNLVGTPFEFNYDEDMSPTRMENLQSLRDRRRSFDCRNAHGGITHDATKYSCANTACKIRTNVGNTANSSTTCVGSTLPNASQTPNNSSETMKNITVSGPNSSITTTSDHQQQSILRSIVQPMLPGPVDMRTYNLGFEQQHSTASQEVYNKNLLGAFDSGTADQALSEFDEEDERAFQSALRATSTSSMISKQQLQPSLASTTQLTPASTYKNALGASESMQTTATIAAPVGLTATSTHSLVATASSVVELLIPPEMQTSMETTSEDVSIDSDTTLTTKASLSDARNQLKLKIKGPLAYPDNYSNSNAITISISSHTASVVQSNTTNVQSIVSANAALNASVCGGNMSGTNSRRMRKKELLSLYAIADDSSCGLPPTDSSLLSNVMDITRKTDSVSSEMGDYSTDMQTNSGSSKRLKKNSSRELRSSDLNAIDHGDGCLATGLPAAAETRRRSACSSGSTDNNGKTGAACSAGKRRGRSKTMESVDDEPAPKLKIKIFSLADGSASATTIRDVNSVHTETAYTTYEITRRSMACPPKKRLTTNYTPTLEDLMRDSMNYRDQVMQEFGGDEEERIKRTKTVDVSRGIAEINVPAKKIKTSKPKKDKKEKKRHKNKSGDVGGMSASLTDNIDMTTTLIEQPISASPGDPPKLILRIGKRKTDPSIPPLENATFSPASTIAPPPPPPPHLVIAAAEEQPIGAPIRLKLARVPEGGGYVIGDKKSKTAEKQNQSPSNKKEELTTTTPLHQSNLNATNFTATTSNNAANVEKYTSEDTNACGSVTPSPSIATYNMYGKSSNSQQSPATNKMMISGDGGGSGEAVKESSTTSPCLIIDSGKSNDLQDSNTTTSTLHENVPPIEPIRTTPNTLNNNENSNSLFSGGSSHSHSSQSTTNSMANGSRQTTNNATNINNNNNSNTNNNNNNNNNNNGLLSLQKDCEVR